MDQENQTPHKRRVRYKGKYPKKFEEKYKELQPEKYQDTIQHVIQKGNTPAGMHISIMVQEILDFLQIQPGQVGFDATLGYGGHTKAMLACLKGQGHMYATDVDPEESAKTRKRLEEAGYGEDMLSIRLQNFCTIDEIAKEAGGFDFILADLGVYGVRRHRTTDTFFKRTTALGFYKIMNALGANTVYNHADYRLMSRRALEGLAEFSEVNLFLRGIVPMIGYPSDVVYYDRKERAAGESKYPLKKMLAFAIEGITSLSTKPIRMITFMGIAAFFVSIGFLIWAVVDFFRGNTITGWASMMVSLWFIGGLLLLSVGIVGEYVGKIYLESKHRPRYIIESCTPDRIREREKGRSRKQEMPGENLRRSRAEARELQTSKRREAVQKPGQE